MFKLCKTLVLTGSLACGVASAQTAVVYYSWFDNTDVSSIDTKDIDVVTGASLFAPGLVTQVAQTVAETLSVQALPIVVQNPYPVDYDTCLDQVIEEKNRSFRPALSDKTEAALQAVRQADTVYLGFPNWSYTLPPAVLTFVESLNWEGKTVIPFCVHGTGGLSGTIRALRKAADKAQVKAPLSLYREDVPQAGTQIRNWVESQN